MIGQITPLVKVAGKRVWLGAAGGHVIGAAVSASALGLAIGALGLGLGFPRLGAPAVVGAGAIFVLCAISDAGLLGPWVPSLKRQTPKWMLDEFGPFWGSLAWGADLGQGWTTRVASPGYFALIAWALLVGGPKFGLVVLGSFGLGRAAPVVVAGPLARWMDVGPLAIGYMRRARFIQCLVALGLALVGGYLFAAA